MSIIPRVWRPVTALAIVLIAANVASAEPLTLAEGGRTSYVLVTPNDAPEAIRTAAAELQSHLNEATGAEWPIREEGDVDDATPSIVLGPSKRASELLPDVDVAKLGDDAIVMRRVGPHIVLTGKPPRGTLYAVYTFLEDVVGCRWWSSTASRVPKRPTLTVDALDVTYAPSLVYREAFYRDAFDGVFAARCKLNGHHHRIPASHGGRDTFAGFVHTFYPVLPPSEYFEKHPEWYSEIDGQRTHEQAQLCLTNEAMRAEFVRKCRERLKADPSARFLSVSQNDWFGRCECAKCRELEETEGSPSGPLLHFVNAVADALADEFPNVYVETLAYQYTRKPPLAVRPRANVIVRLCTIECSFVQPLARGEHNEAFRADIEGWSEAADRLFVWDYVTNFSNYMVPHPNLRVLDENIRYFVDNGVIGLFEQGDSQCAVGDFVELRAWVLAHLMWDPTRDADSLIDEYLEGYYGDAAPHLKAYLDLIHDRAEASGVYFRCFMTDTSVWLRLEDLNAATTLFDEAAAAVRGDPVLEERVLRARIPLDHVWLRRYDPLKRQATLAGLPSLGPDDPKAACKAFVERCERFHVGNWRENVPFKEYGEHLVERFGSAAEPPDVCRDLPDSDWIDFQEFDLRTVAWGDWARPVDDATASNGRAIRMPGDHREWAVQTHLSRDFAAEAGKWRCYVYVRCEASVDDGPAGSVGLYSPDERRGITGKQVAVAECKDGYVAVDLGTHDLKPGMYFWVAPPQRKGEVDALYVDRIVLVRDKAGEK